MGTLIYLCRVYSQLIVLIMCVILFILQPLSITSVILSNYARDITTGSVLLRPVNF